MRAAGTGSKFRCDGALERGLRARGFHAVAGVDEVGRGALFGPVVAAAAILSADRPVRGLNDSKMLEPVRESYRTGKSLTWNRVHRLADFVYFDHSIHVAKGVGCQTCHGQVDMMPLIWQEQSLLMEWCLECHRAPERFVRPRGQVFAMDYRPPADQLAQGLKLVKEYKIADSQKLTSCSTCHR